MNSVLQSNCLQICNQ